MVFLTGMRLSSLLQLVNLFQMMMMMYLIKVLIESRWFCGWWIEGFNISYGLWGCGFMPLDMYECKLNGSRFIIDLFVFCCLFHLFKGIAMLWLFFPRTLQSCVDFCRILLVLVYILIDQCCADPIYAFSFICMRGWIFRGFLDDRIVWEEKTFDASMDHSDDWPIASTIITG